MSGIFFGLATAPLVFTARGALPRLAGRIVLNRTVGDDEMTATHIIQKWNQCADRFNQWEALSSDEQIEFAFVFGREEGGGNDGMKPVTEEVQEILADIFSTSEMPDKMGISVDKLTRAITVVCEDLDDEWFKELIDNGAA